MTVEIVRRVLAVAMVVGLLLLPIAPIARVLNEGFGDDGGPVHVSLYLQRMSYVLIPVGVVMIVSAGIGYWPSG